MSVSIPKTAIADLVNRLLSQTKVGKVRWKDDSTSYLNESFRTSIGVGSVTISPATRSFPDEEGEPHFQQGFSIVVTNSNAQVVADFFSYPGDTTFDPTQELFETARLVARDGGMVIDSMLQALGKLEG